MPTVVGEMMPFRFGYVDSSASVLSNEVWSSSLPYTVATILMFGYFCAVYVFMAAFQAFWFVAFAAAERMATSPDLPISFAMMSICFRAISCVFDAAT